MFEEETSPTHLSFTEKLAGFESCRDGRVKFDPMSHGSPYPSKGSKLLSATALNRYKQNQDILTKNHQDKPLLSSKLDEVDVEITERELSEHSKFGIKRLPRSKRFQEFLNFRRTSHLEPSNHASFMSTAQVLNADAPTKKSTNKLKSLYDGKRSPKASLTFRKKSPNHDSLAKRVTSAPVSSSSHMAQDANEEKQSRSANSSPRSMKRELDDIEDLQPLKKRNITPEPRLFVSNFPNEIYPSGTLSLSARRKIQQQVSGANVRARIELARRRNEERKDVMPEVNQNGLQMETNRPDQISNIVTEKVNQIRDVFTKFASRNQPNEPAKPAETDILQEQTASHRFLQAIREKTSNFMKHDTKDTNLGDLDAIPNDIDTDDATPPKGYVRSLAEQFASTPQFSKEAKPKGLTSKENEIEPISKLTPPVTPDKVIIQNHALKELQKENIPNDILTEKSDLDKENEVSQQPTRAGSLQPKCILTADHENTEPESYLIERLSDRLYFCRTAKHLLRVFDLKHAEYQFALVFARYLKAPLERILTVQSSLVTFYASLSEIDLCEELMRRDRIFSTPDTPEGLKSFVNFLKEDHENFSYDERSYLYQLQNNIRRENEDWNGIAEEIKKMGNLRSVRAKPQKIGNKLFANPDLKTMDIQETFLEEFMDESTDEGDDIYDIETLNNLDLKFEDDETPTSSVKETDEIDNYENKRFLVPHCALRVLHIPDISYLPLLQVCSDSRFSDPVKLAHCLWDLQQNQLLSYNFTDWFVNYFSNKTEVFSSFISYYDLKNMSLYEAFQNICPDLYYGSEDFLNSRLIRIFATKWLSQNSTFGFLTEDIVLELLKSLVRLHKETNTRRRMYNFTSAETFVKSTFQVIQPLIHPEAVCAVPIEQRRKWRKYGKSKTILAKVLCASWNSMPQEIGFILECMLREFYDLFLVNPFQVPKAVYIQLCNQVRGHVSPQRDKMILMSELLSRAEPQKKIADPNIASENDAFKENSSYVLTEENAGFFATKTIDLPEPDVIDGRPHFQMFNYEIHMKEEKTHEKLPWLRQGLLLYKKLIPEKNGKWSAGPWCQRYAKVAQGKLYIYKLSMFASGDLYNPEVWEKHGTIYKELDLQNTFASVNIPSSCTSRKDNCFTLSIPGECSILIQVSNILVLNEWIHAFNFNAAMASCHPLPENVTNTEYGWGPILRRAEEKPHYTSADGTVTYVGDLVEIQNWESTDMQGLRDIPRPLREKVNNYRRTVPTLLKTCLEFQNVHDKMLSCYCPGSKNHSKALSNWNKKMKFLYEKSIKYKEYLHVLECEYSYRKSHDFYPTLSPTKHKTKMEI
ncbi:meiotically upregulated Mug79 [Schizosaccharomyces cryophilus OY26]|uniref:Meiotically upregulated Mug79 n=1 Tax=Schizosaccharomyces cryophilus (strain OY26 / ATCC MYA-4695 / CBS 11777 / NBRC 106824 / NRRL Y48691) TaxID=653667 RepID=S9VWY3_SCHCR|nr:meiotically upregulated Mug79 [Schizosaccharomyces cryophilus OY26]EPY52163.1 meiotically upregulated Mug79 [Schizosaccharomyces cryophilus OY26]